MNYAFLVDPKSNPLTALQVDNAIKPNYPQVQASTVAGYTIPWIVIVHTEGELSEQERQDIQGILDNLDPS